MAAAGGQPELPTFQLEVARAKGVLRGLAIRADRTKLTA
jgi:hypothetical protein